jgi:hypothetical protein
MAMPRGFQCGDGWFDVIHGLCERLEPFVIKPNATLGVDAHFAVLQIKQKFGGLRFYVTHHTTAIDNEIDRAHLKSLRTCENCGRRGVLRNKDGYLTTLCEGCLGKLERKTKHRDGSHDSH